MLDSLRAFSSTQLIVILAVALALGTGIFILIRIHRRPKDKEKHRRQLVNLHGRIGDATITEVSGPTIFYSYSVGGVTYSASQDVSQLEEHLPRDFHRLIGAPTSLKYFHQNPANSIILCEEWSGLRATSSEKLGSRR